MIHDLRSLRTVSDWEAAARERLPTGVYDYYAGGAEDEVTLRGNRLAFRRWVLRPRRLVDVSRIDTGVEILGVRASMPVALAPTAFHRLAHPEGEVATARAAGAEGVLMVASTVSTRTIEEIAEATSGPLWLQLYVFRNRDLSRRLVERAEAAGCRAVCLTVDVPLQGNRERDVRNRFALPPDVLMANFRDEPQARMPEAEGSGLAAFIHREFDPSLTWDAVEWLTSITRLPVVLKGVLRADDAGRAVERGVAAIVVSNHGGRQLDGAEPTLSALPRVVEAVAGRVPVLLDGGVRRGSDVVKALALGARCVLVGRPYLWGLAVGGEEGVRRVLTAMRTELERAMGLCGCRTVEEIGADLVAPSEIPAGDPGDPGWHP